MSQASTASAKIRKSLDGLRIEATGPADLTGALLGMLPDAEPGPVDLRIRITEGPVVDEPPRSDEPAFVHYGLRCYAKRESYTLCGAGAEVRVDRSGTWLEGRLTPSVSSTDRAAFSRVTLLIALTLALRAWGRYHLHGGAVLLPDGRLALCLGNAGSGKSTVTARLVEDGCAYLGDDALLVRRSTAGPKVAPLPRPFHLHPTALEHLPQLREHALGPYQPGAPKLEVDVRGPFGDREVAEGGLPLLLLFPRVEGVSQTLYEPLAPADALAGLIESSALVAAPELLGTEDQLALLGEMAAAGPALRLRLGPDALAPGRLLSDLQEMGVRRE